MLIEVHGVVYCFVSHFCCLCYEFCLPVSVSQRSEFGKTELHFKAMECHLIAGDGR